VTTVNAPATIKSDSSLRTALADIAPVVIGVAPFGVTIGATAVTSSVNPVAAWLGGPLIAAGSAHLTVITLLGAGTSVIGVLLAALVVNARLAAYSAVLAPRFVTQPTWFRWLGPYVLVDQTFALALSRDHADALSFRRYLLTVSGVLLAAWVSAITLGMALGPVIPASWELWFATPLMFVAMTIPSTKTRPSVVAALTAAILALVLSEAPSGLGLVTAILFGAVVGSWAAKR
jgi:predicted branched-subunit amino acid permease